MCKKLFEYIFTFKSGLLKNLARKRVVGVIAFRLVWRLMEHLPEKFLEQ